MLIPGCPTNPMIPRVPIIILASLTLTGMAQAALTYVETFPGAATGNLSHNDATIGWNAYYGSTAINDSSNTLNGAGGGFVVSNLSGGYGAKAVASGASTAYGITYTTEVAALGITVADITNISFLARNGSIADRMRVVIGIDVAGVTQWFASNTAYATAAGAWADGPETKNLSFSISASSWRALTFTTGSLSLADTTLGSALPSGNLVAAGLFLSGSSTTLGASGGPQAATMRYDDFTVTYVPEPSAAAFGALALGVFSWGRRRKH